MGLQRKFKMLNDMIKPIMSFKIVDRDSPEVEYDVKESPHYLPYLDLGRAEETSWQKFLPLVDDLVTVHSAFCFFCS